MIFKGLDKEFLEGLKDKDNPLHFILEFEHKNRKSFIVEIRKNFLDLYFLGHGIEVKHKKRGNQYCLIASKYFNPKELLKTTPKTIVKPYGDKRWQIGFDEIENYDWFKEIMSAVLAQIARHRNGSISEGVSEVNHLIDNRAVNKNGVLVIDRQVVYPGSRKNKMDLLGLRRLPSGKYTFSVIELKNKNNKEIEDVFTRQLIRYIDVVYDKYDDFVETYANVLKQKVSLGLLKAVDIAIATKNEIEKRDIEGIIILDNYNIRSDLRPDGLLNRALRDWGKVGSEYTARLFLKTNILDSTFFLDRPRAEEILNRFKASN